MVKKRQADLDVGHTVKTRSLVSLGSKSAKGVAGHGKSLFSLVEKNRLARKKKKLVSSKGKDTRSPDSSSTPQDTLIPKASENDFDQKEEGNTQKSHKMRKQIVQAKERSKGKAASNFQSDGEDSITLLPRKARSKMKASSKQPKPGLGNTTIETASVSNMTDGVDNPRVRNDSHSVFEQAKSPCNSTVLSARKKRSVTDSPDNSQLPTSRPKKVRQQSLGSDIPSYISDDSSTPTRTDVSSRADIQAALKNLANRSSSTGDHYMEKTESESRGSQALWTVASNLYVVAFSRRVELRGFVSVTSLTKSGDVVVHGHRLGYKDSTKVFAPPGYRNGVFEYQLHDGQHGDSISKAELRAHLPSVEPKILQEIDAFCREHKGCALLLFSEFESTQLQACVDMLPPSKVMPGYISLGQRLLISDCYVAPQYALRTLQAVQYIVSSHKPDSPIRVVICGDKNMGKSTLIRYIINRLLSLGEEAVTHLECDPSQCEFSPPGCLTLHSVRHPLLGPPWTHILEKVDNSQLYGALSADLDPDKYVRCMRRLAAVNRSQDTGRPLIVNTMGWKQGLGLEFLAATIAEVKPTHVIQLCTDSTSSYRNFDSFSVLNLISHDLYLPKHSLLELRKDLDYELMQLAMPHCNRPDFDLELLSPALSRDLSTTAYMFMSSLPHQTLINDLLPYSIGMSDVALDLGVDALPSHLLSDAVRMQMVVLCQTKKPLTSAHVAEGFQVLRPSADLIVIGYGLVRAIDSSRNLVYISTPLPTSKLSYANVLYKLHGTITPELWYYHQLCKVKDSNGLPYLNSRKSGAGVVATGDARYRFRRSKNN